MLATEARQNALGARHALYATREDDHALTVSHLDWADPREARTNEHRRDIKLKNGVATATIVVLRVSWWTFTSQMTWSRVEFNTS